MSFNNLRSIIGPAPSERDRSDLMLALSTERDRIRRTLIWFREREPQARIAKEPKAKRTGGKPATKIMTKLRNAGLTVEELERALAYLGKENAQ